MLNLSALRADTGGANLDYYAVKSDFQPDNVGWNFLQYFSRPMQRIANFGADLIFEDANDLIVDTPSMIDLGDQAVFQPDRVLDFGTNASVYHTNYFCQKKTLDFIREKFGIT